MNHPNTGTEGAAFDVLLIGAGPVGLYGAYYAGFRSLSVGVVDALPQIGGQVTAMYPEKDIYDVAGFPAVRGRDLIDALFAQARPFDPTYLLDETVTTLSHDDDGLPTLATSRGRRIRAEAVVVTGGVGSFHPRPLPAAREYEGRGLVYFVTAPEAHRGEDVVVVGGGDSALDWAKLLHPIARSVTLVHRRERFRAHEHTVKEVRGSPARFLTSCQVVGVRGNGRIEVVDVAHRDGTVHHLPAQTVVAALGFLADLGPLRSWGLTIERGRIRVDSTMATNLPRVYAAGDITTYPGKVKLISVGFGEVATAVNNAAAVIDPSAAVFPGHSTEVMASRAVH